MWGIGSVFLLADLWLIIAPLNATHVLGVLATVVIAIGSLAILLGTLAFLVQTRQPLPLFRALRLNVTPVLTIIMIIALADGIIDKNSALHQVAGPVAAGAHARPSLAAQPADHIVRETRRRPDGRRPSGQDRAADPGSRLRRRHPGGLVDRQGTRHDRGRHLRPARRVRRQQRQRRIGGNGSPGLGARRHDRPGAGRRREHHDDVGP
jgi:hypothetical protein